MFRTKKARRRELAAFAQGIDALFEAVAEPCLCHYCSSEAGSRFSWSCCGQNARAGTAARTAYNTKKELLRLSFGDYPIS